MFPFGRSFILDISCKFADFQGIYKTSTIQKHSSTSMIVVLTKFPIFAFRKMRICVLHWTFLVISRIQICFKFHSNFHKMHICNQLLAVLHFSNNIRLFKRFNQIQMAERKQFLTYILQWWTKLNLNGLYWYELNFTRI